VTRFDSSKGRLLVAVSLAVCSVAARAAERGTVGRIERASAALDRIVPPGAVIEVLAEGFRWSEGPVWDRAGRRLLFSDVPNNVVHAWSEKEGPSSFLKPSGYTGPEGGGGREPGANGLAFDRQGRLVLCQHGDRRVSRLENGRFVALVDRFEGKRFNSPNDLVLAADGAIYFTDPPYGLTRTFEDPGREIGWNGVYRLGPDGSLSVLVKDLKAPNGIGLSPDGRTLYVGQSDGDQPVVMAYDITKDGAVSNGRVLLRHRP
jgi:gluconolactonase